MSLEVATNVGGRADEGYLTVPPALRWTPAKAYYDPSYVTPRLRALRVRIRRTIGFTHLIAAKQQRSREGRQTRRSVARATRRTGSTKSPPGEQDPPPSLRRLEGGGENSRDSNLNRGWQYILELRLSPVELETLGIYCSIRSTWEGRWAA